MKATYLYVKCDYRFEPCKCKYRATRHVKINDMVSEEIHVCKECDGYERCFWQEEGAVEVYIDD